jgi:hypothetical protein
MNLIESGNEFVKTAEAISKLPVERLAALNDPLLNYIYINWMRNGNGHESLQKTMALGYREVLDARSDVYNTQIIVFVCMTTLICVIGVFVFLPILLQIETSKDDIMKQFVILPTNVRVHMHHQALGRVRSLRREFLQDEDAEETSSEDDDEETGKRGNHGSLLHDEDDSSGSEDNVDWDDLLGAGGRKVSRRSKSMMKDAANGKKKKGGQLYRKSSRSFLILVLRFIGPLVSLLIMFVIIFAVFATTLDKALTITSIATAASYRASCARQAIANLRKVTTSTTNWIYRRNLYWIAIKGAQCMRNHVRLLSYGDGSGIADPYVAHVPPVENGASSVLSPELSTRLHEVMFGAACPFLMETIADYTMEYCQSLNGGILAHGLAPAAEVW